MPNPICRFCQAPSSRQAVKGRHVYGGREDQKFWQCADCQMIYLDPPLTEPEEKTFYQQEFEKYMAGRSGGDIDWSGPEKHFQSNQKERQRRMAFLEPFLWKGKKVLEIGCSSGFMLSALHNEGCEVYGVDPSEGFIGYVRSKGIPVFSDIKEAAKSSPAGFDLILHYYVLEHIRHPVEFLRDILAMVKKGGRVIFEVPCASDPLVELYHIDAFDKFYWSVAHHWYFNRQSLGRVLEKVRCPFQLFPEQRYDLSNHMVWMMEGKPGGMGRFDHVLGKDTNRHYKEDLKRHWTCDTIIAVLEK